MATLFGLENDGFFPLLSFLTITVIIVTIIFVWLEIFSSIDYTSLIGLPIWLWTVLAFILFWLVGMAELLLFRLSNTYTLRQDGLEIRRGIIRLHSFVVTPAGFGDLLVYQGVGGRLFGYGDITVNSQGERQTKLMLVHAPFAVADTMRDIMGKPIVRVEGHV
jgi:membrane protein YdbS with pleckstrin-like domain